MSGKVALATPDRRLRRNVIFIIKLMSILKHGEVKNFSSSCPYVYVDGVYLKRSWGGEIQNVSILAPLELTRMDVVKSLV